MRVQSFQVIDRLPALLAASLAATIIAVPALADSRNPAPIVYRTSGPSARISPERQTVFITPSQARPSQDKASARVQFTYPGTGTVAQSSPSPAASVPKFATPAPSVSAREYASISAPISSAPEPLVPQAAPPKPFDPQAAARRIAAERQQAVVQAETLPALAGEPTPAVEQGLTQPAAQLTPAATHSVVSETIPVFDETGDAIVYGDEFQGLPTANGEIFSQSELMAAHPNLPLPSLVQVVNLDTNTDIVVRVNDRGPFEDGAMLQVSQRAAAELGMSGAGRANVRVRYLGPAPILAPNTNARRLTAEVPATAQPKLAHMSTFTQPAPVYAAERNPVPSYQPVSVGNYFVQVGAFSDISNAESLLRAMPANMSAQIDPAKVNGTDFFRVRVGPFMSRDAADRMRDDLNRYGISSGRVVSQN